MPSRRYRLQARAASQEETRQRIVEATAALHAEVGPAATTISAIAERAGVQRLTVYRHFPDDLALFSACASHAAERHPAPDPGRWSTIMDPGQRLLVALEDLYQFYARDEQGLAHVLRDAEQLPALACALAPMSEAMNDVRAGLRKGWRPRRGARHLLDAALAHALDFWTWRSLAAKGLSTREAAGLMRDLVAGCCAR